MSKVEKILTAVVVVLAIVMIGFGWQWKTTSDKWDTTKGVLTSVRENLEDKNDVLAETESSLHSTENELDEVKSDLNTARDCVSYIMNDMPYRDMGRYGVLLPKSSLQELANICNPVSIDQTWNASAVVLVMTTRNAIVENYGALV